MRDGCVLEGEKRYATQSGLLDVHCFPRISSHRLPPSLPLSQAFSQISQENPIESSQALFKPAMANFVHLGMIWAETDQYLKILAST